MESKKCTVSDPARPEAAFLRLQEILHTLRRECPWDKEQSLDSLRYLTIEEVHELSEAIIQLKDFKLKNENSDASAVPSLGGVVEDRGGFSTLNSQFSILNSQLKKELGDLAMHILFYCMIAEEEGLFSTADVYNAICDKLISRHPFIYDKENYHGENWEQLKMREGRKNVLEGVPDSLPSLIKAIRMQEKVAGESGKRKVGNGKWKVESGKQVVDNDDCESLFSTFNFHCSTEEQFGELLFSLIDWGRRHGLNADDALCLANSRFAQQHANDSK